MLLHDHPLSPYAQKVRIMLREKGLPFEAQVPDGLGTGEVGAYSSLNPRLEVPALTVDGRTLFDSTIILDFIEERYPDPPMMPDDPFQRAEIREIEEICDTHYEAINWGLGEVRFFGRAKDKADQLRRLGGQEIAAIHAWLEGRLSSEGWLSGAAYGRADISALPYVTMSKTLGFAPPAGSALEDWLARMLERPAVAETNAEAEAAVVGMAQYSGVLDSGTFRRHFRDHRLEWMIRCGGVDIVAEGLARNNVRFTDLSRFAGRA